LFARRQQADMVAPVNNPNASASGQSVTGAIRQAAKATGTNFQYLLAAAKVESNLNPNAAARTSSAGGLFQFIDQTWLGTIKQSGAELGYGKYADAIQQTESGKFVVSDAKLRNEIMELRKDPTANAVMAGAFTKSNADYLSKKLGREPTDGELYMAHFLGAGGAAKLINLAAATPNALARDAFPRAAAANKSIFYGEGGRPRSFAEVTGSLSSRYDVARAATQTPAVAAASSADTARVAQAYAASAPQRVAAANDVAFKNPYRVTRPGLQGPDIRTPAMRAPATVAPEIQTPQAVAPANTTTEPASAWPARPNVVPGQPLNLFQDQPTNVRALFGNG
jgi:hypothetical protein